MAATLVFVTAAGSASASCVGIDSNAAGYAVGCLAVGAVAGLGMAASLLMTARLARRDAWLLTAVLGGTAVSWLAGAGAMTVYYSPVTCLR